MWGDLIQQHGSEKGEGLRMKLQTLQWAVVPQHQLLKQRNEAKFNLQ